MKIAIVGGGIGGLTAALALSQNSHDATAEDMAHALSDHWGD